MTTNENKIKKSDRAFSIVSRIVTALIAFATFPIMIFTNLFELGYTIPYFYLISGDSTDTGETSFKASISKLYELYKSGGLELSNDFKVKIDFSDVLAALKPQLIALACLFGALLILALFIIIMSAFTKKKLPIVISSVLGMGVLAFIPLAFSKLSAPFLDGTLNLDSFLHTGLESILDLVVQFDYLRASDSYTLLWVVFVAIFAWTGAVMLVNMDDKSEKIKEPKQKNSKEVKATKE